MAKLYAELSSDKGGRVASKGGDSSIVVMFRSGNKNAVRIEYRGGNTVTLDKYDDRGQLQSVKVG